jgi:hypothetical protein
MDGWLKFERRNNNERLEMPEMRIYFEGRKTSRGVSFM